MAAVRRCTAAALAGGADADDDEDEDDEEAEDDEEHNAESGEVATRNCAVTQSVKKLSRHESKPR
jgi:hypothetical protein